MKPLRSFPLPINVGTDICQISRVLGIVASGRGKRFVDRILTPSEREKSAKRLEPINVLSKEVENGPLQRRLKKGDDSDDGRLSAEELAKTEPELWSVAAFLAGRFAAKEAAIKAHSYRRLSLHDVIIERRQVSGQRLGSGPPIARIVGTDGEEADESALISISHDGDYATAVCIGHDPTVG